MPDERDEVRTGGGPIKPAVRFKPSGIDLRKERKRRSKQRPVPVRLPAPDTGSATGDLPKVDLSPAVSPEPVRLQPPPTRTPRVTRPTSVTPTAAPALQRPKPVTPAGREPIPQRVDLDSMTAAERRRAIADLESRDIRPGQSGRFGSPGPFEQAQRENRGPEQLLDLVPVVGTVRGSQNLADNWNDLPNAQKASNTGLLALSAIGDAAMFFGVGYGLRRIRGRTGNTAIKTAQSDKADELLEVAAASERVRGKPVDSVEIVAPAGNLGAREVVYFGQVRRLTEGSDPLTTLKIKATTDPQSLTNARNLTEVVNQERVMQGVQVRDLSAPTIAEDSLFPRPAGRIDVRPELIIEVDSSLSKVQIEALRLQIERDFAARRPLAAGGEFGPQRPGPVSKVTVRTINRGSIDKRALDDIIEARVNAGENFDNRSRVVREAEIRAETEIQFREVKRSNPDLSGDELTEALKQRTAFIDATQEKITFNKEAQAKITKSEDVLILEPELPTGGGQRGGVATKTGSGIEVKPLGGGVKTGAATSAAPVAIGVPLLAPRPEDSPDVSPVTSPTDPDLSPVIEPETEPAIQPGVDPEDPDLSPVIKPETEPAIQPGVAPGDAPGPDEGRIVEPIDIPDITEDPFLRDDPKVGDEIADEIGIDPIPTPTDKTETTAQEDVGIEPIPVPPPPEQVTETSVVTEELSNRVITPVVLPIPGVNAVSRPLMPGENVELAQFRQGEETKEVNLNRATIKTVAESESQVPLGAPVTDIRVVKLSNRPPRRRKFDIGSVVATLGPFGTATFEEDIGQRGVIRERGGEGRLTR